MSPNNGPNNGPNNATFGNNGIRRVHFYLVVAGFVLSVLGLAIRAGIVEAHLEDRQDAMEKHLDYDDEVFARKDVIGIQISQMQEEQKRIETLLEIQNEKLSTLPDRRNH